MQTPQLGSSPISDSRTPPGMGPMGGCFVEIPKFGSSICTATLWWLDHTFGFWKAIVASLFLIFSLFLGEYQCVLLIFRGGDHNIHPKKSQIHLKIYLVVLLSPNLFFVGFGCLLAGSSGSGCPMRSREASPLVRRPNDHQDWWKNHEESMIWKMIEICQAIIK